MSAQPNFYRDLAYVFVAATGGGLIARWLRQPLILGYVLGGILIGPFTPGPTVSDVHVLELLAEVGVILLMYSIGIEFSLDDLRKVKWTAVIGGPLGILLSIGLGLGVGAALGWSTQQGIAIGATVSVASTMVLSRLLMDRGELQSPHGRLMIGITLIEDLAVVILTVLLPSAGALSGERLAALALDIGKSLALLIPIMFVTAMVAPRLMAWIARMGSEELYLLIALALGLAVAAMTQAVGLSLALGAFLAGVVISGSEEGHKTLNKLLSLRDAFVALFFVTIGALVNPRALISNPSLLVVILGMIVVGKLAIWTTVVWVFRYPFRTAVLVGLGLTQIGEFSYVLAQVSRKSSLIGEDVYNATLAASLISILFNAALMRLGSRWIVPIP